MNKLKKMSSSDVFRTLHPGLQGLVAEKGWKDGLSEVQLKAIPVILAGHDCIIEAPTAGGKTEAVFFPTLTRASQDKKKSVQVLYLAPLRALLNNIEIRAEKYAEVCGLDSFKWHGDVGQREKIDEFRRPSQLLLTTPESLEAILLRKSGWVNFFSGLEVVIIDEAHNFAFGDRGGHLVSLLERLEKALQVPFQRIALTATIGNPEEMLKWLAGLSREPGKRVHVSTKKQKEKDYLIHFFDRRLDEHYKGQYEKQSLFRKIDAIYKILPNKKTIVFNASRSGTEAIATAVGKMNQSGSIRNPVRVRTHHSSVSKYYREEAEKLIRAAEETGLQAIISTSTLELGIDIGELDQVIQVGGLTSSSAFLQRVGRTGRREGKKQFFRGICIANNDLLLLTAVVSLGKKGISEAIRFSRKAYHLLAHQLICLSLQHNGIRLLDAWDILSHAYCFSDIQLNKFEELAAEMIKKKFLREVDCELVVGEEGEKSFLGSNWRNLFAVFDGAPMYDVVEGKKHVGTLDSAFVESLTIPFLFVLGGMEWKAEKVNPKTKQVIAKKTKIGEAPRWDVFQGADVPIETAKEAGRILFANDYPDFLDNEARDGIEAVRNKYFNINWHYGKWVINVSESGNCEIYTFAGDAINRTLALLIRQEGISKVTSSYKRVEIKSSINDAEQTTRNIFDLLTYVKSMGPVELERLGKKLTQELRLIAFSRFSKCLPKNLFSEALGERSLDIDGLRRELKNNKLEIKKDYIIR
ncbi:MAG: DEAD/DEAH box helicase [Candidatus Aminicenantes bacterium]|nr:DEAD/DEAH box helicase [Candidatus Aminicenantes bacterium]